MWFIFGFITLISFTVFAVYNRLNASWSGESSTVKGVIFQYKTVTPKSKIKRLLVGINARNTYDYSFKKETLFDRTFKTIGLSCEHQTGNTDFDDLVYIVSDNGELHRQLSSKSQILNAVIEVFKTTERGNCKVKEIRHNSGRLWVEYKTSSKFDNTDAVAVSRQVAPILKTLSDQVETIPSSAIKRWRDPFVLKAAVILGLSSALTINGVAHLIRLSWTNVPFTVDVGALFYDSVHWGVLILSSLAIISIILLGRSARAHLVLLELVLIGSFGAISTSFSELRDSNMELDNSTASVYEEKIIKKELSRSRRSTSYWLYVNDWNNESDTEKVSVSSKFYSAVSRGDLLVIRQKTGYHGYKWVESIKIK